MCSTGYNINGVPLRDAGDMFFRYSDDDGLTWSDRHPVVIPHTAIDCDEHGDIHGWNFGHPRMMPSGHVLMTYTKMKRSSLYPVGWQLDENNQWITDTGAVPVERPANEQ